MFLVKAHHFNRVKRFSGDEVLEEGARDWREEQLEVLIFLPI